MILTAFAVFCSPVVAQHWCDSPNKSAPSDGWRKNPNSSKPSNQWRKSPLNSKDSQLRWKKKDQ
jgi:hypothetical protein